MVHTYLGETIHFHITYKKKKSVRLLVDSYGNFEAYYTVIAEGDKEETKELKVVEIYKSYMKCNTKLEYVKNISSLVLKIQY